LKSCRCQLWIWRSQISVLLAPSCQCQLWIWRLQMPFYWRREAEPVKQIFATVKSTIDTDNSSNTVLLFLFLWNSPNLYTLVWKHTNKWRNICTFGAKYLTGMVTSVPPYETFGLIKKNILRQSKIYKNHFKNLNLNLKCDL
jgi:hypothetical protein